MKALTYLFFNGNCEEAFTFYAKVLNAKIEAMMKHAGTPAEGHVPADFKDKIIHACLTIGDQMLMASDTPAGNEGDKKHGFSVTLLVPTREEADRIFNALSEGGKVTMPIGETFFSPRFGMLVDRFDVPWMINYVPAEANAKAA
jgi:PhnB protein